MNSKEELMVAYNFYVNAIATSTINHEAPDEEYFKIINKLQQRILKADISAAIKGIELAEEIKAENTEEKINDSTPKM